MNYADLLDLPKQIQWRGWASIPRHPAYESGALPTELPRHSPVTSLDGGWFTVHFFGTRGFVSLGLMNPLLCQLSYRAKLVMRGELKQKTRTYWVSGLWIDPARRPIIAERPWGGMRSGCGVYALPVPAILLSTASGMLP